MSLGPCREPGVTGGSCWALAGVLLLWMIPSAPCLGEASGFQWAELLKATTLCVAVWHVGVWMEVDVSGDADLTEDTGEPLLLKEPEAEPMEKSHFWNCDLRMQLCWFNSSCVKEVAVTRLFGRFGA